MLGSISVELYGAAAAADVVVLIVRALCSPFLQLAPGRLVLAMRRTFPFNVDL